MHHPTERITHTTAFGTPVVEHWLEREIARWIHDVAADRVTGHARSCARERACPKLDSMWFADHVDSTGPDGAVAKASAGR